MTPLKTDAQQHKILRDRYGARYLALVLVVVVLLLLFLLVVVGCLLLVGCLLFVVCCLLLVVVVVVVVSLCSVQASFPALGQHHSF